MKRLIGITTVAVVTMLILGTAAAVAASAFDFGVFRDQQLSNMSNNLYGVGKPLAASSTQSITQAQARANPTKLATLAQGLQAHVVTTQGPSVDDQISLWPNRTHPQYLIACNEQGTTDPGLVRIQLSTGNVTTIVTGTSDCDPTRVTPGHRPLR